VLNLFSGVAVLAETRLIILGLLALSLA
jgi:hypothetical protein